MEGNRAKHHAVTRMCDGPMIPSINYQSSDRTRAIH